MAKATVPILPFQKFNHLTSIRIAGKSGTNTLWECRCVCGKVTVVRDTRLRCGIAKSCGCKNANLTHGHARGGKRSRAYTCWCEMIRRCYNPNFIAFRHYGGRGIKICDRWRSDFAVFLADMGAPPSPKHEVDRYPDKDGDYEPGNCRWATRSENMRNTRRNHLLTFAGKTQCLAAWAEELGIPRGRLKDRICKLRWPVEKALSTAGHCK